MSIIRIPDEKYWEHRRKLLQAKQIGTSAHARQIARGEQWSAIKTARMVALINEALELTRLWHE